MLTILIRLLEEIRSGIKHFVPAEAPHRNPNVALKLLEPNGYDMARGHARISPLIHTTRRSQPDLESPIIHARDHRKRKSYANKMVTPVHRYKYPMPKLKFEGLTSRTRYSRLFRFLSGAALPTKSCWPESILSKHIAA